LWVEDCDRYCQKYYKLKIKLLIENSLIELYNCIKGHGAKNLPLTTFELKNIRTTSDNNGIQQGIFQLKCVPILSDVVGT
jgi:hypothetical protein